MKQREQQKQETRKLLIKTAFLVYAAQGFSATTSQIAKEAGVSHGTVFVHFQSRDELLLCLIRQFYEELGTRLHLLARSAAGLPELLRTHLGILKEYEAFYRQLLLERSRLPHEAQMLLISMQAAMAHHFAQAAEAHPLQEAVAKIPRHLLFNTWMAMLHYYLEGSDLFSPGKSVLETHGELLLNSYLAMISGETTDDKGGNHI